MNERLTDQKSIYLQISEMIETDILREILLEEEQVPSTNELAKLYGEPANTRYYRLRDLAWKWQKRYREEHGITLYDVTDERLCHTIRS